MFADEVELEKNQNFHRAHCVRQAPAPPFLHHSPPPSLPPSDVSAPPGLCIGALIARQHANVKDDVIEQL